jgi:hypothetical protein
MKTFWQKKESCETIFFNVVVKDINCATDVFKPVFIKSNGPDSFISIEVSPVLLIIKKKKLTYLYDYTI